MPSEEGLEGRLAAVALIVSLVALFVTLAQLLIQGLGTAEGYRRCAESVIGFWHQRRERVWLWSEFRFETRFVTPRIILASPDEIKEAGEEHEEVYILNSSDLQKSKELERTVHPGCASGERESSLSKVMSSLSHRAQVNEDAEKAATNNTTKEVSPKMTKRTADSELLVSWLCLLRELHAMSVSYWPHDCDFCETTWCERNTGLIRREEDIEDPRRTDAAVIYRQWTWDFMPPEAVRPLAQSTVGDMVVLALRMGMHWRALDPINGKMQADGNGYSMSATDVRGLGLVLKFTSSGSRLPIPRIVPSRAADKMLCGIIPGDPYLVKQDFNFVGPDRKVQHLKDGILQKIGLSEDQWKLVAERNYDMPHNELIVLLCPFLPLSNSNIARHCFPGWRENACSVFFWWEGTFGLLCSLRERLKAFKYTNRPQHLFEILTTVLNSFELLEREYGDDFYCRWRKGVLLNRQGRNKKRLRSLINTCRELFDQTTAYFIENYFTWTDKEGKTKYLHLVAAHVWMSTQAAFQAVEYVEKNITDKRQPALRQRYHLTDHHGPWFWPRHYETGAAYARLAVDEKHGVEVYMRDQGFSMEEGQAEAAWWMLMLRGLAWAKGAQPAGMLGEPVPSIFYSDKTPIWIT